MACLIVALGAGAHAGAAENEPLLLAPASGAKPMWKPRDASTGQTRSASSVTRPATWESGAGEPASDGLKWKPRWPAPSAARHSSSSAPASIEPASSIRQAAAVEPELDAPRSNVRRAAQLQSIDPLDDPFGDRTARQPTPAPLELDPPRAATGDAPPSAPMRPAAEDVDPAPMPMPMPAQPMPEFPPVRPFAPRPNGPAPLPRPFEMVYCEDPKNCIVPMKTLQQLGNEFLDITPDLEPNVDDPGGTRRMEYMSGSEPRSWEDRENQALAQGRMVDFRHGRVIVEPTGGGSEVRIPFDDLSTDDLCYVTAWWRLPQECMLGDERFAGRSWTPMTWTWTASALCHKPLYFEEEALERYGHMAGPLAQPALSGAHFFLNIAVLPYKMGINPPNECQYALGYYRPGSCAPWILDPIPLSLRGALFQTTAVAAGITAIP